MDPCFGGKTLQCKHNPFLCSLVRGAGYKPGCNGQCVLKVLTTLAGRGIDFNYIYAAEIGKGWVVSSDGPKGPGLYFVNGNTPYFIKPHSGPKCNLACALGKGATVALGCSSPATCAVSGALIVLPGVEEARGLEEAEVA